MQHHILFICVRINYIINYKNKNWLQFLYFVKATALKQQILKFYPKIQRTKANHHIYHRLRGSDSPVLTATGFVNGKGQFSTPHRIDTPQPMTK